MPAPLHDVRVIAVEQYVAGPYGTLQLAGAGAEVIKIESPGTGDVGRFVPPYAVEGDSLFFQSLNRSKKSLAVDLGCPAGQRVLHDLVAASDAVYSNLRGDVPGRLGIRYAQLSAVNPRIVCCSLSGYGLTGPRTQEPGFDYMVQALSGWMSITGEPDGPPTKTGLSVVDFATGYVAALSLMVGVHAARRDGVGGECDVSLHETATAMLSYLATWHLSAGYRPTKIARSSHPTLVPFGMFPTADGWLVAGGSKEKFWLRLADALGLDELTTDDRFRTFADRLTHRDELTARLDEVFRTRTSAHWLEVLPGNGVPCAPVNDVTQAFTEPQLLARGGVVEHEHPRFGTVRHAASAPRFTPGGDGATTAVTSPTVVAPARGADTHEILSGLLGYSEREIARLVDAKVVEVAA